MTLEKHRNRGKRNRVTLLWVPGDLDLERNELAVELAKERAATESFCDLGDMFLKEEIRRVVDLKNHSSGRRKEGLGRPSYHGGPQ